MTRESLVYHRKKNWTRGLAVGHLGYSFESERKDHAVVDVTKTGTHRHTIAVVDAFITVRPNDPLNRPEGEQTAVLYKEPHWGFSGVRRQELKNGTFKRASAGGEPITYFIRYLGRADMRRYRRVKFFGTS